MRDGYQCTASKRPPSLRSSSGQGLAEYLIIVILVAIIVIVGIRFFGDSITGQFQNATDEIDTAGSATKQPTDQVYGSKGGDALSRGDDEVESTSGGGQAESGDGDSRFSGLKEGGVGEVDIDPVESIELSWWMVGFLAAIVCSAGVYIVLNTKRDGKSKGKGKKKSSKKASKESGQALVEFLFIAITFLFVILGTIQMAMVLNAYTLVRYAAYNAARAAIVHGHDADTLDKKMHDAARMSLLAVFPRHGRADHATGVVENYLAASSTDGGGSPELDRDPSLTFFGDPITQVKILNPKGLASGTVITFDDYTESDKSLLTVQVTHFYELVIPLVNRILFYVYDQFRTGGEQAGLRSLDNLARETDRRRRAGGEYFNIEYRIPLVATYSARAHTDVVMP